MQISFSPLNYLTSEPFYGKRALNQVKRAPNYVKRVLNYVKRVLKLGTQRVDRLRTYANCSAHLRSALHPARFAEVLTLYSVRMHPVSVSAHDRRALMKLTRKR